MGKITINTLSPSSPEFLEAVEQDVVETASEWTEKIDARLLADAGKLKAGWGSTFNVSSIPPWLQHRLMQAYEEAGWKVVKSGASWRFHINRS